MRIAIWLQHHSVLFMSAVFLMLMAVTFWPGRKPRFDRDARIPLDDDH